MTKVPGGVLAALRRLCLGIAAPLALATTVGHASEQAAQSPASATEPGVAFVRLTAEQYQRSIRDIFGEHLDVPQNSVAVGVREDGLHAVGARKETITSSEMEQYEKIARFVAKQITDPTRRNAILGCAPKSEQKPDPSCMSAFVERAGTLLYRRPLQKQEIADLVSTHVAAAASARSFNAGLEAVLTQVLVSPDFLFRVETIVPDAEAGLGGRLDDYTVASRLSFFLWNSAPDRELLLAAQAGTLHTPQEIAKQVNRMLLSPRAAEGLRAFMGDMLEFDRFSTLSIDTTLYPKFTKSIYDEAREQTMRTIVNHMLVENGTYNDLFTSRTTFLTPTLAALYGVPFPRGREQLGEASPWVKYTFPEGSVRVGLLGQASFLSLHSHPGASSPTLRGKALREAILCQPVPPPPANVNFNIVQDASNPLFKTVRQRLEAHNTEAMCAGCHKIMDPMGLALENFTTASEFRTHENGAPIDSSGELNGRKFKDLPELAVVLKESPVVASCFINRVYSYAVQRKPEKQDRTWLTGLQKELASQEGLRWRAVARSIATSPRFIEAAMPKSGSPAEAVAENRRAKSD